jgi:hypothetical protein
MEILLTYTSTPLFNDGVSARKNVTTVTRKRFHNNI